MSVDLYPRALIRAGGAAATVLEQLRIQGLAPVLDLQRRLECLRQRVRDELYELVPAISDDQARWCVLAIKRALATEEGVLQLFTGDWQEGLPPRAMESCEPLERLAASYLSELERFRTGFEVGHAAIRQRFRSLLDGASMLNGVMLASPALYGASRTYRKGEGPVSSARNRRQEEALMAYYTRAATKTSPFSTLTYTGEVVWEEGPTVPARIGPESRRGCLHFNRAALDRLLVSLRQDPELRRHCAVTLNTTALHRGAELLYYSDRPKVASSRAAWAVQDEEIARMELTPAVALAIEAVEASPGRPLVEVVERLCEKADAPAGEVETFLSALVDRGLLRLHLPVHEFSLSYIGDLARWALQIGTPAAKDLGSALVEVGRMVDAMAVARPEDRPRLLRRMERAFRRAEEVAGVEPPYEDQLVYEDAILAPPALRLGRDHLTAHLGDLALYAQVSSVFQAAHVRKAEYAEFIESRWGSPAVVPFLEFAKAFFESVENGRTGDLLSQGPRVEALRRRQGVVIDALKAATRHDGTQTIISPEVLRAQLSAIPAPDAIESAGFFLQVPAGADHPIKVNLSVQGYGRYYSRFAHLLSDGPTSGGSLVSHMRGDLKRYSREDTLLVDIGAVFGNNANLRSMFLDDAIQWPSVFLRSDMGLISLAELEVRLGAGPPQVVHAATGRAIRPCHFGFLVEQWLPKLARLLIDFGPERPAAIPWQHVLPDDRDEPNHRRRVYFGDLLIHREGWRAHQDDLPVRAPDTPDWQYFIELNGWREAQGIPRQVFVSIDRHLLGKKGGEEARRRDPRGQFKRKPQFIDFENPLFLARMERVIRLCTESLVLEEVYPPLDEQLGYDGDDRYVTELIVQVSMSSVRAWGGGSHPHVDEAPVGVRS